MQVRLMKEAGYNEAVYGFSLSYNTSIERAKVILPKYAFGKPGENKFLESIMLWVEVRAPRYFWQEGDTYRISTKQSESTMHTITKRNLTPQDFEEDIYDETLERLNNDIEAYRVILKGGKVNSGYKNRLFRRIKNNLPEGFLQTRVWCFSYKTLQNIVNQRKDHRLEEWHYFIDTLLEQIEHKEFILPHD